MAINPGLPENAGDATFNSGFTGTMAARQNIPGTGLGTTADREHTARHFLQGFPGWLSQGDVLQPLAPHLSARSDTFIIRTYGDVRNPATGEVEGRAWCEATVQRLTEFVDPAQGPATARFGPGALNADNLRFGRRFTVVSFRWLGPSDI